MKWFLIAVSGVVGGILGGLGMGGGTLLIPMLVNFFDIEQKIAQSINLISFLPTSIVALIVHIKKKRVDFKGVLYIIIPAVLSSVLGSLLAGALDNDILKKCFGFFLIALAFFNVYSVFKSEKATGKQEENSNANNQENHSIISNNSTSMNVKDKDG